MERRTCEMVILAILQKMFSNNLLKGDKKKKKNIEQGKNKHVMHQGVPCSRAFNPQ